MALEAREEGHIVHIAHGGDSMVALADTVSKKCYYQTAVDMNFAGRGLTAPAVVSHPLKRKTDRIILATDGLQDFNRAVNGSGGGALPAVFFEKPVNALMADLDAAYRNREPGWEFDDTGIIVVDPLKPCSEAGGGPIVMGGTSPAQENDYARSLAAGDERAEWIEAMAWARHSKMLAAAGIYTGHC